MRKFVPYHQNELSKITHWLNKLSKEGLCVETWGAFWLKFRDTEERDYYYQVDIDDSTADPNYQRRLELEKQGWQYVQTIGNTRHHIYRTRNQGVKLIWEDAYIAAYQKYLRSNTFWMIFSVLVYIAVWLYLIFWFRGPYALLAYIENDYLYGNLQIFSQIFLIYNWTMEVIRMRSLQIMLQKEKGTFTAESYDGQEEKRIVPYGLKQMVSLFIIIGVFFALWQFEEKETNFDNTQAGLACVDLQSLEEDGFKINEITWKENPEVNFGNRILEAKGLFTEYHYKVSQYGTDSAGRDVQISGSYWKVRPDGLAESLFTQLLERSTTYRYENLYREEDKIEAKEYWNISERKESGFTKLIVAEPLTEDMPLMIFAQKEDIVICLRYYGSLSGEIFVQELLKLYE